MTEQPDPFKRRPGRPRTRPIMPKRPPGRPRKAEVVMIREGIVLKTALTLTQKNMRQKAILLSIVRDLQNEELQGQKFTFPEACQRIAGSRVLRGPYRLKLGYRKPSSARALEVKLRRFERSAGYQEAMTALEEQGGPPRGFVEGFWTPEARAKSQLERVAKSSGDQGRSG